MSTAWSCLILYMLLRWYQRHNMRFHSHACLGVKVDGVLPIQVSIFLAKDLCNNKRTFFLDCTSAMAST